MLPLRVRHYQFLRRRGIPFLAQFIIMPRTLVSCFLLLTYRRVSIIPPFALVSQLAVGFRRVLEYSTVVYQLDGVVLGLTQDRLIACYSVSIGPGFPRLYLQKRLTTSSLLTLSYLYSQGLLYLIYLTIYQSTPLFNLESYTSSTSYSSYLSTNTSPRGGLFQLSRRSYRSRVRSDMCYIR